MDSFRRGLQSDTGADAKTSLAVCLTELIKLVQIFGAGNKKPCSPLLKLSMISLMMSDGKSNNFCLTF
jgi:hypothetical protein